jgi:hypothetical protein
MVSTREAYAGPSLNVLDMYAGWGGWSAAFRDRGHDVCTIDIGPEFGCTITADILTYDPDDLPWRPDIILASPPCEKFSTGGFHQQAFRQYFKPYDSKEYYEPVTPAAHTAIACVQTAVDWVAYLEPEFWVFENPRGLLRKLDIIPNGPPEEIWYCRYGERRAKPTDLWGGFPPSMTLEPICHNGNPDHIRAPRGSVTGTQGMETTQAAIVPYALSLSVCLAAEADL